MLNEEHLIFGEVEGRGRGVRTSPEKMEGLRGG